MAGFGGGLGDKSDKCDNCDTVLENALFVAFVIGRMGDTRAPSELAKTDRGGAVAGVGGEIGAWRNALSIVIGEDGLGRPWSAHTSRDARGTIVIPTEK